MKITEFDEGKFHEAKEILKNIYEHRKKSPTTKTDELYYEMMIEHYQRVIDGKREGRFIVGFPEVLPVEFLYAMDIVPLSILIWGSGAMAASLKATDETLGSARDIGISAETCSGHRNALGVFKKGWLPRPDLIVSAAGTCDNCVKSWQIMAELYDVPAFFLDHPSGSGEKVVRYLAGELEEFIQFLEEKSGQRIDWQKLKEAVVYSRRMSEVSTEIGGLLKATPSPIRGRNLSQMHWVNNIFSGTPEGLTWLETLRDEVKERVEKGIGVVPEERFRIATVVPVPLIRQRVLDWMEREYGAVVAIATQDMWEEVEMDPERPIESICRKYLHIPLWRQLLEPSEEWGLPSVTARVVREYKADGVIIWENPACRPVNSAIRMIRDRVKEEAKVPILVIDHDPTDPTYTTEEELKAKIREFFEILESRK